MMIFITIILLICITAVILIGTLLISNKAHNNDNSKNVVDFFEPDNLSPELTEMIKFHEKNGNVDYNL